MDVENKDDKILKNIITSYFCNVDEEVSEYIHNVLNEGRQGDFNSPDDIYDCLGKLIYCYLFSWINNFDLKLIDYLFKLGELFQDVVSNSTEESIYKLCETIFEIIVEPDQVNDNNDWSTRKLNAPVHLGNIFNLQDSMCNDYKSIWCAQKEVQSQVNKKKLFKAEAKLKQKQEKRDLQDKISITTPISNAASWQKEATTSQMISKTAMKADETGKNKDIKIENFDISFGDKKLLQGAELTLSYGRRYGLVGRNGKYVFKFFQVFLDSNLILLFLI